MHLLHVYAGPFPSHQGTQAALGQLLAAQAARGHRVVLRCWAGGTGEPPAGVEIRRLPALPGSDRLQSGPHPSRARLALALARALGRDLREAFHLVHAHHVEAPILARLRGARPLVHHLHTSLAEELPDYGGPRRLGAVAGAVLDRACVRAADGTVALSERGADLARRWGAARALCIPPAIPEVSPDPDRARRDFDLADDPIVYTGNLDAYQDLDRLVRACAEHELPVLIVTADDPTALLHEARRLGAARLRVVRTRELADHLDILAAVSVSVVPRRRCAGVPIKLLNALACGTPVVVLHGAVDPWPGTLPVPPADLGRALASLRDDPDRTRALALQARRAVRQLGTARRAAELDAFQACILASVTPAASRS